MDFQTHAPETDLALPDLDRGTHWDPMTIFTHAELLSVPGAQISIFCYLRCLPAFGMSQGGISIFQGLDNPANTGGIAYLDYRDTAPWPTIDGNTFTTANGLRLDFEVPGERLRLQYQSPDGTTTLDVVQTAVTPLLGRGHIIPGEDTDSDPASEPGGSEQIMRAEGTLLLNGEHHTISSTDCRDRSWRQVRSEAANAAGAPPICWTPMHFGEHLTFNQVSIEPEDTDPLWSGLFEVPTDRPTHHFAWVRVDGEMREITSVRRTVHEYHPVLLAPIEQTVEASDSAGQEYRFHGVAMAMGSVPTWTNATLRQILYRWTNESTGDTAENSGQEIWLDQRYARHAAKRLAEKGATA